MTWEKELSSRASLGLRPPPVDINTMEISIDISISVLITTCPSRANPLNIVHNFTP
jgi:hypothetical protein